MIVKEEGQALSPSKLQTQTSNSNLNILAHPRTFLCLLILEGGRTSSHILVLIDFRGRGKKRKRDTSMWERNINQLPVTGPSQGPCNLGKYPDWESNPRPLGIQDVFQPTEPLQPGQS